MRADTSANDLMNRRQQLIERGALDAIIRPATTFTVKDQTGVAELSQVMREQRLGDAQSVGKIADAALIRPELLENSHPGWVSNHAQLRGDVFSSARRRLERSNGRDIRPHPSRFHFWPAGGRRIGTDNISSFYLYKPPTLSWSHVNIFDDCTSWRRSGSFVAVDLAYVALSRGYLTRAGRQRAPNQNPESEAQ